MKDDLRSSLLHNVRVVLSDIRNFSYYWLLLFIRKTNAEQFFKHSDRPGFIRIYKAYRQVISEVARNSWGEKNNFLMKFSDYRLLGSHLKISYGA